jgi:hypothetical protein
MSTLQHGIPLCSTISKWSDNIFREWRCPGLGLSDPSNVEDFISSVLAVADEVLENADLGKALKDLYEARFSWPVISESMLAHLG